MVMKRSRQANDWTNQLNKKHRKNIITISDSEENDDNTCRVQVIEKEANWSKFFQVNVNRMTQLEFKNMVYQEISDEDIMLQNYRLICSSKFLNNDGQLLSAIIPKEKSEVRMFLIRKKVNNNINRSDSISFTIDLTENEDKHLEKQMKRTSLSGDNVDHNNANVSISSIHSWKNDLKFDGTKIYVNKLGKGNHINANQVLSIQQILETDILESCYLCTYSFDVVFFETLFPFEKKTIPVTLVKHWVKHSENEGKKMLYIGKSPIIVINPPLPSRYSNMHSKLWLLCFPSFLRVVVSSANLCSLDWNCYTQAIWIQDFPKTSLSPNNTTISNDFKEVLMNFWNISTLGLPSSWLNEYDFTRAQAHLICSVPGSHSGSDLNKYGHMRIRNILRSNQATCTIKNQIENSICYYQASSLGYLTDKWMEELCESIHTRLPKDRNDSFGIKIIYPSLETVHNSKLGIKGAGMICLQKEAYTSPKFPKNILCDFKSGLPSQENYLPHSKMIIFKDSFNKKTKWIYLGSHNLSSAALGRLQKKNTQLFCTNYEVGVILIGQIAEANDAMIPFAIPPEQYLDNREPFIYDNFM